MSFATTPTSESFETLVRRTNPVHCFAVSGMSDPGLQPRIMEQWAKRGLMPDRWHCARTGTDGSDVYIDIETSELDHALAMQIAEAMRTIFGVSQVLVSEKRFAASA
ncbi:MAG: hypothetical protein JJ899_15120 [Alphaproteobacteria bacterium]|nr:hypothetical protein [Alphaproteobacteria bacterium]